MGGSVRQSKKGTTRGLIVRPRDVRGWRIPKPGSKSRDIYNRLAAGERAGDIARSYPERMRSTISVLIWRIRNPEDANEAARRTRRGGIQF